jgi:hypothetical protein
MPDVDRDRFTVGGSRLLERAGYCSAVASRVDRFILPVHTVYYDVIPTFNKHIGMPTDILEDADPTGTSLRVAEAKVPRKSKLFFHIQLKILVAQIICW